MKAGHKTFISKLLIGLGLQAVLGVSVFPCFVWAERTPHGHKEGYITSVKRERHQLVREVVLIPRPPQLKSGWHDQLFVPELRDEFKEQYRLEFGRTEATRNLDAPSRYAELEYSNGVRVTPQEDVDRKQRFGGYMVKRLSEYHVDQFFKSNPTVKPVYEMKEKLSKMKVEVEKGYEMKFKYSLSGNYLELKMENPYKIKNRLTLQMNTSSFGPGPVEETIVYVKYPFDPGVSLATDVRVNEGTLSLIGQKKINAKLSSSITGSTFFHNGGETQRQHRIVVGLSWTQ